MKSTIIENSPDSFADFHDGDWIKEIFTLADDSHIEDLVEDFCAHWWGSARMFVLPWLLVNGVRDAGDIKNRFTLDEVWAEYLENNAFKGALWKVAENSYCSLYYAYENLLVSIASKSTNENLRVTSRDFTTKLNHIFGESTISKIWTSSKIVLAKEVRNSIVHNGGKATDKLKKLKYTDIDESGDILISASDTRNLYNMLQPLIKMLIKRAVEIGS